MMGLQAIERPFHGPELPFQAENLPCQSRDALLRRYRENPEFQDQLRERISQSSQKDGDGDYFQKKVLFPSVGIEVLRVLLFCESPYFRTMFLSECEESFDKEDLSFKEEDVHEEGLKWLLGYFQATQEERMLLKECLSVTQACQLLYLVDKWQIADLIERCDRLIAKNLKLDENSWKFFESRSFFFCPYIRTWVFLCRLLAENTQEKPYSEAIQQQARRMLDFDTENPPLIELKEPHLSFLSSVDVIDRVPLTFDLNEIVVHNDNLGQLYKIALNFESVSLLKACLEFEASSKGISFQSPGPKEYYVDGPFDNYISGREREHAPGTSLPERYVQQRNFYRAPYPVDDVQLILSPKKISADFISLLDRYRTLSVGLTLKSDHLASFAAGQVESPSIKLLQVEPDATAPSPSGKEELDSVISKLNGLHILVIPEEWEQLAQQFSTNHSLSIWKSLSGKVETVERGVHTTYDCLLRKSSEPYADRKKGPYL